MHTDRNMPRVVKKPRKEPDNIVERAAKKIVPPSDDTDDTDLKDPGTMTPRARPTDNRS